MQKNILGEPWTDWPVKKKLKQFAAS